MMVIENKYDFGQMVFLKTDVDQKPRIVISMEVFRDGELLYKLASGENTSLHYDYEICEEEDKVLKSNS